MAPVKKRLTPKAALERAKQYCAKQERSHQQLRDKLYDWGLHKEDVENALVELIGEDFLNEERFARSFAIGKFRVTKWGKIKIRHELKGKRISENCIQQGLEDIDEEEYLQTLKQLAKDKSRTVKAPNDYIHKNKVAKYLMGKGYEPELVWDVLKS